MTESSPIRFDIEDARSDTDVEVLPNGLEAFNESRWPAISDGGRSPCSRAIAGASSRDSRAKPIPAGFSSAISGSAMCCAAGGSGASS
jgi:hypothetical protein